MKKLALNKQTKNNLITYAIVVAAYIIVQILIAAGALSYHLQGMLVSVCTYIIMAISLNLTVGILGELSLGHAGFMCVGAFLGAIFSIAMKDVITFSPLRFLLALIIGAVSAGIIGFLIGMPVLRLKGDYLAIVTLAFGEIIKNLFNILFLGVDENGVHMSTKDTISLGLSDSGTVIVKGAQGVTGMPQDANFTIGAILILLTLFIVLHLIQSRDGRAIMSIRDNQIAAESVGIHVSKYKLMAFTISAALAGMAGAFYVHSYGNMSSSVFDYNLSIMILVFVVLGGIGSIRGSIIAATVLTLLPELLRFMSQYRMLVYAIVLIIMMLFNWSPKAQNWKKKMLAKFQFPLLKQVAKTAEDVAEIKQDVADIKKTKEAK
ncbi:MAG: branched-chain amino acid ABC transporter permease [Lachnospiraceae bacterium]|nr:branched-chain amino acid ABC transporter permease [Lachnospiraceae bacterium]